MSDATAESLSKREGELSLSGLTSLSDAAAESLSKHRGGILHLNGLTSLSDATAEILSKREGELSLSGLTSLSDATAESLSKREGELSLSDLTSLSDAAANSLRRCNGQLEFDLDQLSISAAEILGSHPSFLKVLTYEMAEKYWEAWADFDDLDLGFILDSCTAIEDAAAESLSETDVSLELNGLRTLSDAAAESLSRHKGKLELSGLRYLSDAAAESLSRHKGELVLDRLSRLSGGESNSLLRLIAKGDCPFAAHHHLSVSDVATVVATLNELRGEKGVLDLRNCEKLTAEVLAVLSDFEGDLKIHLSQYSKQEQRWILKLPSTRRWRDGVEGPFVEVACQHCGEQAKLEFPDNEDNIYSVFPEDGNENNWDWTVCPDCKALGLTSDNDIGSDEYLSVEDVEQFLTDSDEVDLSQFSHLEDDAAELLSISEHQGSLDLSGLERLSTEAAEALAKYQGSLDLSGLKRLTTPAAEALVKHQGSLDLSGLKRLTTPAAEALAKYQGKLDLSGLTSLSAAAVAILRTNENVTLSEDWSGLPRV